MLADVRFWHLADIERAPMDVRFHPVTSSWTLQESQVESSEH
jgi:hypothetical protein